MLSPVTINGLIFWFLCAWLQCTLNKTTTTPSDYLLLKFLSLLSYFLKIKFWCYFCHVSSCFKIHPLLCVYPTSQLGWAWCTAGRGFCSREGSGEWQACSGMCVSETQGQASCRGRGKEPRLLPAGEGQWVERVNIADSQTGSGGQTEEEERKTAKGMHATSSWTRSLRLL